MLGRLSSKLAYKFLLLGALLVVAVVVPVVPLLNSYHEQIVVSNAERGGLAVHQELRQVLVEMQRHRGASTGLLSGKAEFGERVEKARAGIDAAVRKVDAAIASRSSELGELPAWRDFKARWTTLAATYAGMKAPENLKAHTEVIAALLKAMDQIADKSGLVLDPEMASYYLMDVAVMQLPSITERMGVGRAMGALILSEKSLTQARRDAMIAGLVEIRLRNDAVVNGIEKAFSEDPAGRERIKPTFEQAKSGIEQYIKNIETNILGAEPLSYEAARYFDETSRAIDAGFKLYDTSTVDLDRLLSEREAGIKSKRLTVMLVILLGFAAAICFATLMLRRINRSIVHATEALDRIAAGRLDLAVPQEGKDEIGMLLARLGEMQTQLRERTETERRLANENLRIRIALDNVSTGVMIADTERSIIYANPSVVKVLKAAEADIRRQLPSFSADKLVGQNIDAFHRHPAHQAKLLGELRTTHTADLEIGGHFMRVQANPVINDQGERLGSVAEWADRTAEVLVEREAAQIVEAAANGDFSRRFDQQGKDGFFRQLGEHMNRLLENSERGLNEVAAVMAALAKGDLTRRMDGEFSGTFGQLKSDVDATVDNLQEIIAAIKQAADAINTASREIAAGNTDLSARTEEQASSLEQTASSMEELTGTVKQNADNARQANELASNAQDVATHGGDVVAQVVQTMGAIHQSSSKIADIIGVIDGIAFQTNILALNAAVEAARAGEQGRGFAVVATEVRNLAQRSAAAAKEIKGLISDSVSKVQEGNRQVEAAGVTMGEVVGSIRKVARIMTDISAASREQSSGIEQVGLAVSQMDEVTQQNAALVEQAAAAAESLEEQAHELTKAVSVFQLSEGRGVVSRTPRHSPTKKTIERSPRSSASAKKPALPHSLDDEWEEF